MGQHMRKTDDRLQRREVRVVEPGLSRETNDRLTAEVREVVGDDHVTVPVDRPRPSHGEASQPGHRLTAELKPNRFVMALIGVASWLSLRSWRWRSVSGGSWWARSWSSVS